MALPKSWIPSQNNFYIRMSISVSIVEDDAQGRASLVKLIDSSPGFRCVSNHASAENALQEIPKVKSQVVLMDINLPGINGVECVRRLKPQMPGTQVIMLTVYQNTEHIFNALAAGATGYMLQQTPPAGLLEGIQEGPTRGPRRRGPHARGKVSSRSSSRFRRCPPRRRASRRARRRFWTCWRRVFSTRKSPTR